MSSNLKTACARFVAAGVIAVTVLATPSAFGALLGLSPSFPDINSSAGAKISYNWDDINNTGGVLTIQGSLYSANKSLQLISFAGEPSHYLGPTAAAPGPTDYLLTANFDASGMFTGGSVSILGYVTPFNSSNVNDGITPPAGWANTGTVLTGTLTDFGFLGDATAAAGTDLLRMDFRMTPTGGDLYTLGYTNGGGVIASGNVGGGPGAPWTNSAFQQDFATCATCGTATVDTFVPVPAAAWLFMSGLIGLGSVAKRKRQ